MREKEGDSSLEEMIGDTLLYVMLFKNKLTRLSENKIVMKTLAWLLLVEQLDNPSISELGDGLNVSKSQMTARVDKLVEAGLIERVPDKGDRRKIWIVLTPEGKDFIKNSQKTVKENMNQLLSPLSLKEVEELKKSIRTIKKVSLKIQDAQKNRKLNGD